MPSSVVGRAARSNAALNCTPWLRSLTQRPLAWTNSSALIIAAAPTTVTRSRWPRTLTRRTRNSFSVLWNVITRDEAREALDAAVEAGEAYMSSASTWEIAQKASLGRLVFATGVDARAFIVRLMTAGGLTSVPLTDEILLEAYELPDWGHRDPADRMIVATARWLGAPVLTSDRRILAYADTGAVTAMPL